jgi:nitrogen fixation NifU-like protein
MEETASLYRGPILDHGRHPRNFGPFPEANLRATGDSPICGDHITVALRTEGERVATVRFEAVACAVCQASASMMTDAVSGKTRPEALALASAFIHMLSSEAPLNGEHYPLGELAVFADVKKIPSRKECAVLPWTTLTAALEVSVAQGSLEET